MLISTRCSLLTGQFAQWRGHGKSYCVGVRRFMFEAWLFVLAHRARLPDTVDFVLYDLFSILQLPISFQRSIFEDVLLYLLRCLSAHDFIYPKI